MKVLVGIPTYNNVSRNYSIRKTLEALSNQTFNDFKVLIVYKKAPGDKTINIISQYKDLLDIKLQIQEHGYFNEAVNIIFEEAKKYDLVLTTDDDAIPESKWVEEHIKMHKKYTKIGVISGTVNGYYHFLNEIKNENIFNKLFKKIIFFYKPLIKEYIKNNYVKYINDIGITIINPYFNLSKISHISKLYCLPIGVNMSFKGELIDNFKLPQYNIRGLHNETLLATYMFLNKNKHSLVFKGANVIHLEEESLSRVRSRKKICELLVEHCLLPYGLYSIGISINIFKAKFYSLIKPIYSLLSGTYRYDGCVYGLNLALEAIRNNYKPLDVRNRLIEIIRCKCRVE
jgi:hypothetical protein